MMFWYGGHWAFWQAGMMWAGTLVFWGLLIWGVYALIRFSRRPRQGDRLMRCGASWMSGSRAARFAQKSTNESSICLSDQALARRRRSHPDAERAGR